MAAPTPREEDLARADELRRRLYRADATAADLERYEAVRRAAAPVEAPDDPPPAARTGRRRGRVLAAGTAVLVVLTGAAVVQQTAAPTLLLPAVPTQAVTIGPAPDEPVREVPAPGGAAAQAFTGRGPGTASLDAAVVSGPDGRMEIMLTVGEEAPVRWEARRVEIRLDGDQVVRVLGEHASVQARGVPSSFRYSGTPPTSLRVHVPSGVGWNLVVLQGR